jgi:hypothetical protein
MLQRRRLTSCQIRSHPVRLLEIVAVLLWLFVSALPTAARADGGLMPPTDAVADILPSGKTPTEAGIEGSRPVTTPAAGNTHAYGGVSAARCTAIGTHSFADSLAVITANFGRGSPGGLTPDASTTPHARSVATNTAPRVTEPMIRDAMADAPLLTQQTRVSLPRVQRAVDQLAAGSPAPPIKVDGSIIVNGNHRYIAGQIMEQPPAIQPWPGGRPGSVIPWDKQIIDSIDWPG